MKHRCHFLTLGLPLQCTAPLPAALLRSSQAWGAESQMVSRHGFWVLGLHTPGFHSTRSLHTQVLACPGPHIPVSSLAQICAHASACTPGPSHAQVLAGMGLFMLSCWARTQRTGPQSKHVKPYPRWAIRKGTLGKWHTNELPEKPCGKGRQTEWGWARRGQVFVVVHRLTVCQGHRSVSAWPAFV